MVNQRSYFDTEVWFELRVNVISIGHSIGFKTLDRKKDTCPSDARATHQESRDVTGCHVVSRRATAVTRRVGSGSGCAGPVGECGKIPAPLRGRIGVS
jgi:hypothetical protein